MVFVRGFSDGELLHIKVIGHCCMPQYAYPYKLEMFPSYSAAFSILLGYMSSGLVLVYVGQSFRFTD